jgi:hypothetical protein
LGERWLVHSAEATTTGELPDSNYRFVHQSDRDQRTKVTVDNLAFPTALWITQERERAALG